jgi:hypothetical protein
MDALVTIDLLSGDIDDQLESIRQILDGEVDPSDKLALAPGVTCTIPIECLVHEYLDFVSAAITRDALSITGDLATMRRWSDLMLNMKAAI